ncbi:MAG: adenylyl-sulfate kinase [Rickettsiales bacterium]|nr:adenylyl-sulfate kinase [Rickettsiales bacterium]
MSTLDVEKIPKVVVVGHIDHGKSSFIGRLMYDLDQIPDGKYDELRAVSKKRGADFEFAFLMDALQSERDQGITIDTTQIFFKTQKRKYVFIDAPGHKEFVKNMITGASSADIAMLIVDVSEGVKEQTKKHSYLLKLLGIENVIVLFNKMDRIKNNEKKYSAVKKEMETYLKDIDVKVSNQIPISAKFGDNIVKKSSKIEWYKEKSVSEILDEFDFDSKNTSGPLRLPVQDIYKIKDKRIVVGRVESGKISSNDELLFSPSNETVKIKSFEEWPKARKEYFAGESIAFTLNEQIFVDRGNLVSHPENPPKLMQTFEANIFWLTKKKLDFKKKYSLKINTGEYSVIIKKIKKVINTNNLESKLHSNGLVKNDIAEVVLHSSQLIPMDDFKVNKKTGRFCLLDNQEILAGGIVDLTNYPDQRESEIQPNIKPVELAVKEIDRSNKFNHRSAIIWLTGLSGSGKSTIAKEVERKLFLRDFNVFVLDGDNLRIGLNKGLKFSTEDRTENIRRTAEVAKLFSQAGFIVIVSLISPYKSERKKARDIRPEIFKEIYVSASIEECTKRDVKGLYAKANKGEIKNFTGITSPYEEPDNPDLILNTEDEQVELSVKKLESFIIENFSNIKKKLTN